MARCHWSLICSPQPVARLLRALPKLAIIFLAVHFVLMIYSVINQPARLSKKESTDHQRDLKPVADSVRLAGNLSQENKIGINSRDNQTNILEKKKRRAISRRKRVVGRTASGLLV